MTIKRNNNKAAKRRYFDNISRGPRFTRGRTGQDRDGKPIFGMIDNYAEEQKRKERRKNAVKNAVTATRLVLDSIDDDDYGQDYCDLQDETTVSYIQEMSYREKLKQHADEWEASKDAMYVNYVKSLSGGFPRGEATAMMNNDACTSCMERGLVVTSEPTLKHLLMLYVEEKIAAETKVENIPFCVACWGANRMLVAMDGNFSHKRNLCAMSAPHSYKVEAIEKTWGKDFEVREFEKLEKEGGVLGVDKNFVPENLTAASGNATKGKNIETNGVFATGCARHGIPFLLYDIKQGEGHKYALASVKKILGMKNDDSPLDIVYDIACK
ncbi:hypothetical protein ABG067_007823, partial [Albugo candida]